MNEMRKWFCRSPLAVLMALVAVASAVPAAAQSTLLEKVRTGEDVVVVVMGTSLTSHGAWPAQLETWLNEESPRDDSVRVINRGVSGSASNHATARLSGVQSQLPRVLEDDPDVVFIEFAINDAVDRIADGYRVSLDESKEKLEHMIQAITDKCPDAIIILQTMNNVGNDSRPALADYYQGVRDVAEENNLLLIDHEPVWLELQREDPQAWQSCMKDPVHPNTRGAERIILPTVRRALEGQTEEENQRANIYDVVVYGGTSAGVIAAVQAKRDGLSVVVVGPDVHLGGLSSGGLGWTDSGDKLVIGGLSRDFYERLGEHYGRDGAAWTFEPHVAEQVFEQYVAEHDIPVHRDRWLDREGGVEMDGRRIVSIAMLDGATYHGKMFIDATYEGDLMAAAGVNYIVGRESNETYGETLNGVATHQDRFHQFAAPVDPYVVPGDPRSGLLPEISADPPGEDGQGDHRIQAYCFRMCLTRVPENRVPFPQPEGYDPARYELLLRTVLAGANRHRAGYFSTSAMPNGKTDSNNAGPFSTDFIGANYDYPEATYERRAEIIEDHRRYQQGLMYFLSNDPRVPADVRTNVGRWGLCKDEFVDSGHWPHQLYIREARRMVGDFVTTERHIRRDLPTPSPIGMGSYMMDSHHVQRYVTAEGHVRNEGDVQVRGGGPYPIDYGAIVPKRGECENLLVPVCVSASHIAFGSIRMEPVFMILGQSAAQAAKLAIDESVAVQDVDYTQLADAMHDTGQVLRGPSRGIAPDELAGMVVDDDDAEFAGKWTLSHATPGFVHHGYRHDGDARDGKNGARFTAEGLAPGRYEVRLAYTAHANRSSRTRVTINHARGETVRRVDQREGPAIDGMFVSLGTFVFTDNAPASVIVTNQDADGYVVIDAVQWVPVAE